MSRDPHYIEGQPVPKTPPPEAGLNTEPGSQDDGWVAPPPVTLRDGTRVQLFKDGEGLKAAYDAIAAARKRVCLEIYIFRNDATGRKFAELLAAKAREGLRVFIVYDSLGSFESRDLIAMMRHAGVRVAEFHPVLPWRSRYSWRPWNRDHRKMLICDDDVAGLGGLNIGDEYGGGWVVGSDANPEGLMRDQAIGVVGPGAKALLQSFAASWRYVRDGGRIRRALYTYNVRVDEPRRQLHRPGKQPPGTRTRHKSEGRRARRRRRVGDGPCHPCLTGDFALLASAPTLTSPLRPVLRELLDQAERSILIVMAYFAPDDELILDLCEAAARGVRVRLILPARSDLHVMVIAARSFYARLMACGVEVYERRVAVLHAKTLVVDGRVVMIGSTNLDHRSVEFNCEVSALVESTPFAEQVTTLLEHDIRFSTRVDPSCWRQRPWRDRFVQWLVSRARYLL